MKRLLAAAERRLGVELAARAKALAADDDAAFTLATDIGRPVAIFWRGDVVARLERGRTLLAPKIKLHRALDALSAADRAGVEARVAAWLETGIAKHLAPLVIIAAAARDPQQPAYLRALLAPLAEAAGTIERSALTAALAAVDRPMRHAAAQLGVKIGTLDVYCPALLKPEPIRWRLALATVFGSLDGGAMPEAPPPGAAAVPTPSDAERFEAFARAGYRPLGAQMLRVDLAERLARIAHDGRNGRAAFAPDPGLATSLGLRHPSFVQLMLALGFRPANGDEERSWVWRGPRPPRLAPPPRAGNAFGALAALRIADG